MAERLVGSSVESIIRVVVSDNTHRDRSGHIAGLLSCFLGGYGADTNTIRPFFPDSKSYNQIGAFWIFDCMRGWHPEEDTIHRVVP
jgi:hypothetical protein